jgi:hypothetical protein
MLHASVSARTLRGPVARARWCYNVCVGRTRRRRRSGKRSGGALTSLRGGFQSVTQRATGTGPARATSRARRVTGNVITALLLVVAVVLLLRRFGIFHR